VVYSRHTTKMKVLCIALLFAAVAFAAPTDQFINDNNVLNYALTLENFEAEFYRQALAFFGTTDTNYTDSGYPVGTAAVLSAISLQETNHANFLTAALGQRGWPAVSTCTYNFGFTTVDAFFATLSTIELTGTEAYDGAARALTNKDLLLAAATIATVEARHTAAIQYIRKTSPFFGNTTEIADGYRHVPRNQQEVFDRVKGFFVSCNNVTQSVGYLNNQNITVNSYIPSTYTWQTAAVLRGASNNVGLAEPESDANAALYWGVPGSSTNLTRLSSDGQVLNYALTLENLESAFYTQFASSYSADAIVAATGLSAAAAGVISQYIGLIAQHEQAHVIFLNSSLADVKKAYSISDAQLKISPACASYNWTALSILTNTDTLDPTKANFTRFLNAAIQLESTGVKAYAGAITSITNSFLTTIAASIATVEAEHTSYLIQLNQTNALLATSTPTTASFPSERDEPQGIVDTITALAGVGKVIGLDCAATIGQNNLPSSNDRTDFFGDSNLGQPSLNNGTVTTGGTSNGGTTNNSGNNGTGNSGSTIVISAAVIAAAAVFVL